MKFFWTLDSARRHNYGMALSLLFASLFAAAPPVEASTVQNVRIGDGEVIVAFDDLVAEASAFSLSGPDRIAIDISGATAGGSGASGGLIRSVRQGQFDSDTTRIVLDLNGPARVRSGAFAADGKSLHLQIEPLGSPDLVGQRQVFMPPLAFRAEPPSRKPAAKVALGRPSQGLKLPKIYGPTDSNRPLVVIDAGHGGHDPGAISPHGGQREKYVTLAIAKAIRDRLIRGGRVRVALTRDDDRFLVLEERFGIARKMKADLFISIHADAAGNETASGATVYTLSEVASDREAAKLAARENKANIINGVNLGGTDAEVSSILIDLTQRETMNVSTDFAKLLHREGSQSVNFRAVPHRFASFVVLKAPDTPSILFETGYLTNEDDVKFLSSPTGQQQLAEGVGKAVEIHFARKLASR